MNLKEKTFRDGTSRKNRDNAELDVNYVSIEERSEQDLLKFVLNFAGQLKFYNTANQPDGNWKLFFGGDPHPGQARDDSGLTDAEQVYLREIADYLEHPARYAHDPQKLSVYSSPHRVLLLTWLKLLGYARLQFNGLTGRHLDHYYRDVLQLKEKQAVPDRVNVLFKLAEGEKEYLVERHTVLVGGNDSSGEPRRYALDNDILVNHASVARLNTLRVQRRVIDLEAIHNLGRTPGSGVKSDSDFINMLKWGLGYPGQGGDLPLYPHNNAAENDAPVDLAALNRIHEKFRDPDYVAAVDTYPDEYDYILEQLNFKRLEEFNFVMELNGRQKHANPADYPTDTEWQQAYGYIESAFLKGRIKTRQLALKQINEAVPNGGFIAMVEYAFGVGASNRLPAFIHAPDAGSQQTLGRVAALLQDFTPGQAEYDDALSYVNRKMYMDAQDFLYLMGVYQQSARHKVEVWQRVYEIIEQAQRVRQNYSPSLKRIQVQRLIPRVVFAHDNVEMPGSFAPFGETDQGLTDPGVDKESHKLGFAVSSPLLVLKEGKRVINLSFTFNSLFGQETLAAMTDGLVMEFSGGADLPWFDSGREDISIVSSVDRNSQTLGLQITLEESAPALVAPDPDPSAFTPVQPVTSPYPVIRLSVKHIIEDGSAENNLYYSKLMGLQLQQVHLDVSVGGAIGTGVEKLALRNDDNVLDSGGTLSPFGHNPHHLAGFYLANDEICGKRLTSITIHLEWINLPDSFNSTSGHYKDYTDIHGAAIGVSDEDFEVDLKVFENRMLGSVASASLFSSIPGTTVRLNPVSSLPYEFAPAADNQSEFGLAHTESSDPFDWERYYKLELSGAHSTFLQDTYLAALQNLAAGEKIKQPYTPQVRRISVDYTCTGRVDFTEPDLTPALINVMQIHPFGQVDLEKTNALTDSYGKPAGYHLLPQYNDSGHLYVGIEGLEDKQEVALLVQMAAGTENSDFEPPGVNWHYLSNDNWIRFRDDELLSDSTGGMLDTGIIHCHPPSTLDATESHPRATSSNYLMPDGLHWLQAQVPDHSHAFPKAIAVHTQAVSATRLMQSAGAEHASDMAPAHTVTKPATPTAAIESISQPYSSFGGKGREDRKQFVKRVSERLRHKGRAVSMWDFEHLVLDRFPEIYKVKCLNQTAQESDPAAAKVKLVVIPSLVDRTPFFPLRPRVSQKLRRQIADYLQDKVSPFADYEVVNPRYEEIRFRVTLTFREKDNEGLYIRRLNQDIINYLSPWAYDGRADVTFGGTIHRSSLIHFITNLPYVDFIGSLELVDHVLVGQDSDGMTTRQLLTPLGQDSVATRFPDSILVSSANHYIDLVTEQFEAMQFSGIGYMAIDADFIVA